LIAFSEIITINITNFFTKSGSILRGEDIFLGVYIAMDRISGIKKLRTKRKTIGLFQGAISLEKGLIIALSKA
jgi:hypothetical protein